MKKILVLALLMAFGFFNSASAGYLLSPAKDKTGLSLALPTGTAIYLMTIESFDVGAGLVSPTYGVAFNEDLVWGVQDNVKGDGSLTPILGAGLSFYVDASGPISGNGPLVALGAFNVIGPDLIDLLGSDKGQGLTPNILFTRNFQTGENAIKGGLTLFVDLGPGTAKKLTGN